MNRITNFPFKIRRIRGNRLYTDNNRRLLDLYLDNGMRLLSYNDKLVRKYYKNAIDKGLTTLYPGLYEHRFKKVLENFIGPRCNYLLFPSESILCFFLRECFHYEQNIQECWPHPSNKSNKLFYRFRPFLPLPNAERIIFTIPALFPFSISVLILSAPGDYSKALRLYQKNQNLFLIPPLFYYTNTRALNSLLKLKTQGYNENHWEQFMNTAEGIFIQNGPYIYPREFEYNNFFHCALRADVLLNPMETAPSIIPMQFSEGEIKKLVKTIKNSF